MEVKQQADGTWSVWHGADFIIGGLESHAAAWREIDRLERRPN
jgi:hypothetical protein